VASTQATRAKHTLPDLPYDYGALEPAISGKIMEVSASEGGGGVVGWANV